MGIKVEDVMKALSAVAGAVPIVEAIYESAKPLLSGADQDTLKKAYERAKSQSDADHAALQEELRS